MRVVFLPLGPAALNASKSLGVGVILLFLSLDGCKMALPLHWGAMKPIFILCVQVVRLA
jgi:hypothetical protein